MVKIYYPPAALIPQANKESVELAGAKCLLAIDEEGQFYNISDIFHEKSLGIFWKEAAISDQIEHLRVISEDAEALYNPDVLEKRIVDSLEKIRNQRLILFGAASFEGNAFESTTMFEELDNFNQKELDRLTNLYKTTRLRNQFPDIKQGKFVEVNFFGKANKLFFFENKKDIHDIASVVYPFNGNVTGILAVAQGAANFIILTSNVFSKSEEVEIDQDILEQMFNLINKEVLKSPLSWFKFDLGLKGIEKIDGWDEIKDRESVKKAFEMYKKYLLSLIVDRTEKPPLEKILDEDLGKPIKINDLTDEEIEKDFEEMLSVMNELDVMQFSGNQISLMYDPPKLLFRYSDINQAAIGGGMYLLSIDVGKNIHCISSLREMLSWGEYYRDNESDMIYHDTYFDLTQDDDFVELKNPIQLRDIVKRNLQNIMKGNKMFLGTLELESNAFEFSLFRELDLSNDYNQKLIELYQNKIKTGKFPKLEDRHIKITWTGDCKDYFVNSDCIGIIDLADKLSKDPAYHKKYAAGIVCVDSESTYFYILSDNIIKTEKKTYLDEKTLKLMFKDIEKTSIAPFCWFKITLGFESLKLHPFWKIAFEYVTLRRVIENYNKYIQNLIDIFEKEVEYRLYE